MPQLPVLVVVELKRQEAQHGRSVEVEHCGILRTHLFNKQPTKRSFKDFLASMPYFNDDGLFDVR